MTEVNVPLLRKAVEWVEEQDKLPAQQREWHQDDWVAAMLYDSDGELVDDPTLTRHDESWSSGRTWSEVQQRAQEQQLTCGTAYCVAGYIGQMLDDAYAHCWNPEGKPTVEVFAREALGLGPRQALRLFDAENEAEDIRRIAENIAGEKL